VFCIVNEQTGQPSLPAVPVKAVPANAVCDAQVSAEEGSSSQKIRVLLADDHPVLRHGLAGLLQGHAEIEMVGQAKDGQEAVELARQTRPDVILMDITMPRLNGIEATRRIKAELPEVCVIGLSMHEGEDMAMAMTGIEATRRIKAELPCVCVIGLSVHEDEDMAPAMREAGAATYVNKFDAADTLIATILKQTATARHRQ
jgi:DNA-binding NarL/FixJ family response regulator